MDILIVYSGKYGCTEKCAKILAEKLIGNVNLCDLNVIKEVELSKYEKVIIGGSIYGGRIRKEIQRFCEANLNVLTGKTLGLFICGMLEDQAEEELNNSFSSQLLTKARAKEFFGGELQVEKMSLPEKLIVKMVSKIDKNVPVFDTNQYISTVSEQRISNFASLMNE
ncbi:MAG: flavodoxin [Peptococcaceae bacterium]|nr:flavodoxin [Peptococcaceae bacterium]